MFRPIAAIFRLLQFCSKSVIYIPILRGDAEISSSLRVTVSLFSGIMDTCTHILLRYGPNSIWKTEHIMKTLTIKFSQVVIQHYDRK